MCADCGLKVVGEGTGCTAMDRVYHIACFTCRICSCRLQGKPFYAVDGEPDCQECYLVNSSTHHSSFITTATSIVGIVVFIFNTDSDMVHTFDFA